MNDRNFSDEKYNCKEDGHAGLTSDPVDVAVSSYLDFLEGLAERPTLDHLTDDDRRQAVMMINSLLAGRGIELEGSTPSVEALLAGTDLEPLLESSTSSPRGSGGRPDDAGDGEAAAPAPAAMPIARERARVERIEHALRGADSRVAVRAEPHRLLGPAVTAAYLDLQAVFFPVDGPSPVITEHALDVLSRVLGNDTDLDYVGVVADGSTDLLTQLVAASDLGPSTSAPSDDVELPWPPVLPLPLALRAMMEAAAPTWEPFSFDIGSQEPLQLTDVASNATRQVLAHETSRPYRGDKGRAYKSFAGSEATFTELIVTLATPGTTDAAVAAALDHIARDAA